MGRSYEEFKEFARSNGVDWDREVAIENLLKGRIDTFMEELD